MRVLENNNYIEVSCPHCKSKLGVHVGDIRHNEIAHRCPAFEVACGACGRSVGLKREQIPANWISTIIPDD